MKMGQLQGRGTKEVDSKKRRKGSDFPSTGEPFLWGMGGALALGLLMIFGLLFLILYNGIVAFFPKPIHLVTLKSGAMLGGEPIRSEHYVKPGGQAPFLGNSALERTSAGGGEGRRTLYRIGNYDIYGEDYQWVADDDVKRIDFPKDIFFVERLEWGPFIGRIRKVALDGVILDGDKLELKRLYEQLEGAAQMREKIRHIERDGIGAVNRAVEKARLELRRAALRYGRKSTEYKEAELLFQEKEAALKVMYGRLREEAEEIKKRDRRYIIELVEVGGKEKVLPLSHIVRLYPANILDLFGKARVYLLRWWEFLTQEPREANTEGGVMPAIFGTFVMTVLMAVAVAPLGILAALFLREYASQGRLVSLIRISVNNLAGVPSIVYGVFGLGFFAYILGGAIDRLFFAERLPSPTFGTGGLLWASLTLALLTVPVVIVATEEALAAVPQSLREGSLACGASKWQTIRNIVLPKALPGIMTGLILAMARGAGEVAPLMLVGVVKLAPELPIDGIFPFIHLERSFMHLGFHIYDVGFQSRNAEAGKPMVFVTTLLLIALVALMNGAAIYIRNRLKRKYYVGHF